MAAWDASTVSAAAALVVACLAFMIALAQVVQQYLLTGQLIRLCDSVVFGPLPGQGHRIWQASQFRFRVVYSVPQLSLDADLWPDQFPHVKSYATGRYKLDFSESHWALRDDDFVIGVPASMPSSLISSSSSPPSPSTIGSSGSSSIRRWPRVRASLKRHWPVRSRLRRPDLSPRGIGEASWVSFWRAIRRPCGDSVRFDYVEYDADRCPPDLVTAPMQVSMRDIVVMGLMAGMEMTDCSFFKKSLSMQGEIGTITSSSHSVLGPILHFTARDTANLPIANRDDELVEPRWLRRTWDTCTVARTYFGGFERRRARRLDRRWIRGQKGTATFELVKVGSTPSGNRERPGDGNAVQVDITAAASHRSEGEDPKIEPGGNHPAASTPRRLAVDTSDSDASVTGKGTTIESGRIQRRDQDGLWTMVMPSAAHLVLTKEVKEKREEISSASEHSRNTAEAPNMSASTKTEEEADRSGGRHHPTVEDCSDDEFAPVDVPEQDVSGLQNLNFDELGRTEVAKIRQAKRRLRMEGIQRDKSLVEEMVKRGTKSSSDQAPQLLLTHHPHNIDQERIYDSNQEQSLELTGVKEEEEAVWEREKGRQELRQERDDERRHRYEAHTKAQGLSFADMFWVCQMDIFRGYWATPWHHFDVLPTQGSFVGAVTVILESLLGFLDDKSLVYTDSHPSVSESFRGTASWLSDGNCTYPAYALNARGGVIAGRVYWVGVLVPAFKTIVIPPLELLNSYEWQVDYRVRNQTRDSEALNVELMRLDSWLSYVGRTSLIADGPNRLLNQTPALIDLLCTEFELDFANIDVPASEGGLQDIQGLSANVMDFLTDESLTEPEQLYFLVALLRAQKVGQSIRAGVDTFNLRDILHNDVQAHLV